MPTTYAIPNGRTVMDATTYTGTNAVQNIVNQANFKPDLVWIKSRSSTASHSVFDSIRGPRNLLSTNLTAAEETEAAGVSLTAFNSNGFALGTENAVQGSTNANGTTYVGWQWQAGQNTTSSNTSGSITSTVSVNATAGFSIVTYTGTGSAATVGHGLGATPGLIIVKERSASRDWPVWTTALTGGQVLFLDSTLSTQSDTAVWNNTLPTANVFSVSTSTYTNQSTGTYVAYCWTPIPGFSAFGNYIGNGSTDGPFLYLGFRPKFLMFKCTSSTSQWLMIDTTRSPYNIETADLDADSSASEYTNSYIDVNSNGFKFRAVGMNNSGYTFVYMAFAENPFKYANAR